jgi:hypothetical protein
MRFSQYPLDLVSGNAKGGNKKAHARGCAFYTTGPPVAASIAQGKFLGKTEVQA